MSDPGDLATDTTVWADWDSQKLSREVMSKVCDSMGDIRPKPSKDRADRRQYWAHKTRNSNALGPTTATEDSVSDHECQA